MIYELCGSKVGKRLIERKVKVVRGEGNFVHHQTLTDVHHTRTFSTTKCSTPQMFTTTKCSSLRTFSRLLIVELRWMLFTAIHWIMFSAWVSGWNFHRISSSSLPGSLRTPGGCRHFALWTRVESRAHPLDAFCGSNSTLNFIQTRCLQSSMLNSTHGPSRQSFTRSQIELLCQWIQIGNSITQLGRIVKPFLVFIWCSYGVNIFSVFHCLNVYESSSSFSWWHSL